MYKVVKELNCLYNMLNILTKMVTEPAAQNPRLGGNIVFEPVASAVGALEV